tara:strand:- start:8544 stop:10379 length:1836 start_codon:yes stop_codon:yes gene_type:complete
MPSARFYDEASHGLTIYNGDPDQKITLTSAPYNWLEASFFYSNIKNKPYCLEENNPICNQDYKDKGFNFKIRLRQEDKWPAVAVGINDIGGTGLYGSEYIVASYGVNKIDFHFGLGWGNLNGSDYSFKNPLGKISDKFYTRPSSIEGGGQFQASRYFSDKTASPFFGLAYVVNRNLVFKLEHDTTLTPGKIGFTESEKQVSAGLDYNISNNFSASISYERDNAISLKFTYKNNPEISKKSVSYKAGKNSPYLDKYQNFRRNLQRNGVGVNKIIETTKALGIELTQFSHTNRDSIEEVIYSSAKDAGIEKEIATQFRIADLKASSDYDQEFESQGKLIYERKRKRKFTSNTNFTIRPFLASREEFFKGAVLLENNSEFLMADNLILSSNIKLPLFDNFDDLVYPPEDTYPAQVRSDIKSYLRNFNNDLLIGRAQADFYHSFNKNNHIMITGGILEDMFSGFGGEYLFFNNKNNYAVGFEVFKVWKRDYEFNFGVLDYQNITGHLNFYYRNYSFIPFDAKFSYGEYLAGDKGFSLEMSRSFSNGMKFGFFASKTDVSSEQFGEGAFDKGIFFNIPVFSNLVSYSWRPLTKDPGQKLIRKNSLHDLLIRFKPIN